MFFFSESAPRPILSRNKRIPKVMTNSGFSKNRPLGRFFYRVIMSIYVFIYMSPQWWAWIFEYSNILIKWPSNIIPICAISPVWIYSDIYLLIFGQPNKFKYLFVNSQQSEYIWIFAQNLILMFYFFIFNERK